MDCRKGLVLALGLLGALGCVPQGLVRTDSTAGGEKPHDPKPESCVAWGDKFMADARATPQGSADQEHSYDLARKAYQQALDIDPVCVPACRALGQLYLILGDRERAVANYQKGLEKLPKQGALWFDLGMCHRRYREWDRAVVALRRANECELENRQYQNMLGYSLVRAGQYDEALSILRKTLGDAKAHYDVARMLHHMNQDGEARQELQAALRADPPLDASHLEAAQLLRAQLEQGQRARSDVAPAELDVPGESGDAER